MNAVFREILSMSFYGGLLALLVAGVRLLLRRSPKWIHCWLWVLVAVRLVCPSLPQSQLSLAPDPPQYQITAPAVPVETLPVLPSQSVDEPRREESDPSVLSRLDAPGETADSVRWMDVLPWVWLLGIAAMGVYAVWSCRRIVKQVGPSIDIGDGVYLCDYIYSPFLLGLWRPKIYLPSYLDPQTAAYVLSHERQHIRRRDHWWKPLGFVLLSIHWFNPLIWMAYILLCRDIEMACDQAVIRRLGAQGRQGYSQALLQCSLPRSTIAICPLAFGEVGVKERIKSVLNYKRPAFWITALALIALGAGAIFFLTDPVEEPEETLAVETTEAAEPEPPYAAELAAMEKDPPRRALDKVEYLPTAIYNDYSDFIRLDQFRYDENYRLVEQNAYDDEVMTSHQEYSYYGDENTLFTVSTLTNCAAAKTGIYFTTLGDGYSVSEGQTVHVTIREEFDENGNVLEELTYNEGVLTCTKRYTYDENGNPLTLSKDTDDAAQRTTYTYDKAGNRQEEWLTVNYFDQLPATTMERRYTWDEKGNLTAFEMYRDGILEWKDLNTYDANGLSTSTHFTSADHRDKLSWYTWDQAGRVKVDTSTAADGTDPVRTIYQFDEYGNELRMLDGQTFAITHAMNLLGTDGSRSIGIPTEIYDEGVPAEPMPALNLPPVQYQEDELKDSCLNALGDFLREAEHNITITQKYALHGPTYLPEEVASDIDSQNFTAQLMQSGQDYHFTRTPAGADTPDLCLMRRNGEGYQKAADGLWDLTVPETDPLNWVQNYRYHRDELTFLSDQTRNGVREITYSTAQNHTITYRLRDGVLVGLGKTGHLDTYDGCNVDLDFETEVTIEKSSLSRMYDLFETEMKHLRPVTAQPPEEIEYPAPSASPSDRSAYEQCMNALDRLLASPYYQVDIQHTADSPKMPNYQTVSWKQNDDLLCQWYSENARMPHTSYLLLDGQCYWKPAGDWLFDSPDKQVFQWDQDFRFALENADTVRTTADGASMEIYFHLAPRANIGTKNRSITFFFQNGDLTSIRDAGILTSLNGESVEIPYANEMKLASTAQWQVQKEFRAQNITACASFSWQQDKAGQATIVNGQKAAAPIHSPQDAFRYTPREQAGEYDWVQVFRDEAEKMWKVSFCCYDRTEKSFYLDDEGHVKLTLFRIAPTPKDLPVQ